MTEAASLKKSTRCVYVAASDETIEKMLHATLPSAPCRICSIQNERDMQIYIEDAVADDVLIAELSLLNQNPGSANLLLGRPNLILVVDGDIEANVRLIVETAHLNHVLVKNTSLFPRLLFTTLAQLLTDESWGVRRYLDPHSEIVVHTLTASSEQKACLEHVQAYAQKVGCFTELPGAVATITSELLMNAIFNAPYDFAKSQAKYKDKPRHEDIALFAGEEVTLSYGFDQEVFVISIRDNFGTLSRPIVVENLKRSSVASGTQIKLQSAGAGVGLYMVLSLTNQLDIHIKNQRMTEVVGIIGLSKRYKDFQRSGHSLNLYLRD